MNEKRFVCIDVGYGDDWYITDNGKRLSEMEIVDSLNELNDENERLKETNEKLQWELDKTREDLNYFANLKVSAMRGSDCGHNRCYVTSMQKKGDDK